jgi:hypothetical protein
MKKTVIVLLMLFSVSLIYGETGLNTIKKKNSKNHFINLNFTFPVNPVGLGYKHPIFKNVYATGNLGYCSLENDLELQAGIEYLFPAKILIFKFYSGTGLQFSKNNGYQFPYITIGTRFIFFFSEMVIPIKEGYSANYRLGFSFRF